LTGKVPPRVDSGWKDRTCSGRTMPGFIPLRLRWTGQHSVHYMCGRKKCTPETQRRRSGRGEWIRRAAYPGQIFFALKVDQSDTGLHTLLPISSHRTTTELIPLSVRYSTSAVRLDSRFDTIHVPSHGLSHSMDFEACALAPLCLSMSMNQETGSGKHVTLC
jgi:hypothetical protein